MTVAQKYDRGLIAFVGVIIFIVGLVIYSTTISTEKNTYSLECEYNRTHELCLCKYHNNDNSVFSIFSAPLTACVLENKKWK